MLMLATEEFLRNGKRNLFLVLLMTVLAGILIVTASILLYEQRLYNPYAVFEGKNGFYYSRSYFSDKDFTAVDGVEAVYQFQHPYLMLDGADLEVIALEEWIWKNWQGRLEAGSWFEDVSVEEGVIPVVVGGSMAATMQVGDEFNVVSFDLYTTSEVNVTLRVIGILIKDTKIPNDGSYQAGDLTYQSFYDIPYASRFFLMQEEYLEAMGIYTEASTNTFVVLDDSVSEEEFDALWKEVRNDTLNACETLSDFTAASRALLFETLLTYMPVVCVGLFLIIICAYAAAYINVSRNVRHYCIYYLVGANQKHRFAICSGNGAGIILLSGLLLGCIAMLVDAAGLDKTMILIFDWHIAVMLAVYYIAFFVIMLLITWLSLRGMSPKEALIRKGQL